MTIFRTLAAVFLAACAVLHGRAATVTNYFTNPDGTPFFGRVTITSDAGAKLIGGRIVATQPITSTVVGGAFVQPLEAGGYTVTLPNTRDIRIAVPDTSGTVNMVSIITSGPVNLPSPLVTVPPGGEVGQALVKASEMPYDFGWSYMGLGDMTFSVYDPEEDGKVVSAETADSVPWSGITDAPTTFAPAAHSAALITSGTLSPDRLGTGTALQVVRRNALNTALEFADVEIGQFDTNQVVMTIDTLNSTTYNVDAVNADEVVVADARGLGGTPIDVRWFGAIPDDSTGDSTALESAAAYCQTYGRPMYIPPGVFEYSANSYFLDITSSLVVIGDGPRSILRHGGLASSQTFFKFSTGTNLVVKGVQLQNGIYGLTLADGHPAGISITVEDVWANGVRYVLHGNQSLDGDQEYIKSVHVNRLKWNGLTSHESAGISFANVPIKVLTVENSEFYGGQFGVVHILNLPSLSINPDDWNSWVTVRNCWFEGMTHLDGNTTVNHQGVKIQNCGFVIEDCVFYKGAVVESTADSQQPVYVYGGMGRISNNTFYRWGNSTDKPNSIVVKGATMAINQADTSAFPVGLGYNHSKGWNCTIEGNWFYDDPAAPTGTGQILFDTDGWTIKNNVFEYCNNVTTLIKSTSSSASLEQGYALLADNKFVRMTNIVYTVQVLTSGIAMQNVTVDNNEILNSSSGSSWYFVHRVDPTYNWVVTRNKAADCPNMSLLYMSTSTAARNHAFGTVNYNYMTNCTGGYIMQFVAGTSGDAGTVTAFSIVGNRMYGGASVVYLPNYITLKDSVVSDNWSSGATYSNPRVGVNPFVNDNSIIVNNTPSVYPKLRVGLMATPESSLSAYPGSLVLATNGVAYVKASGSGNTGWTPVGKFRGATTATPTLGLGAGDSFISNSVFYIYNGTAWRGITIDE